jgi:signal transduction histidine kinase
MFGLLRNKLICILLLFFTFATHPVCQSFSIKEKTNLKNFNSENSSPISFINKILMDKNDFLWISTTSGLTVFDGKKFKNVELKEPRVLDFFQDNENNVYVTDLSNNFYFCNGNTLRADLIEKLNEDIKKKYLKYNNYDSVYNFANQNLHVYFSKNINVINNLDSIKNKKIYLKHTIAGKLSSGRTYFSINNNLYVITSEGDLSIEKNAKGEIVNKKLQNKNVEKNKFKGGMLFGSDNQMYTYFDSVLYRLEISDSQYNLTKIIDNIHLSISGDQLTSGYYSEHLKLLVFGSAVHGLYFISKNKNEEYHCVCNECDHKRSHTKDVYNHVFTGEGDIIFDTRKILTKEGKCEPFTSNEDYYGLYFIDKSGRHWYKHNRFLLAKGNDGKLIHKFELPNNSNIPFALELDKEKILFSSHIYLYLFDKDSFSTLLSLRDFSDKFGFAQLFFDDSKKLCVITGNTCYEIQLETKKLIEKKWPKIYTRGIVHSKYGFIWIGSYGQGYYILKDGQFIKMPLDRNGDLNYAHTFVEDEYGYVWISTNNGLKQILVEDLLRYISGKQEDLYIHNYSVMDGLSTNEFNGGCMFPASVQKNSIISFSSMNGIISINPADFKDRIKFHSKIHFTRLMVDRKPIPLDNCEILEGFFQFSLSIVSPHYSSKNNEYLYYKIDGIFDQWVPMRSDEINLNQLQHGEYTISVKKLTGFGPKAYDIAQFRFTVLPKYYNTLTFKITMGFVFLGLLILVFQLAKLFYIKRNKALQQLIRQKVSMMSKQESDMMKLKEINLQKDKEYYEKVIRVNEVLVHDIKSPIIAQLEAIKLLDSYFTSGNTSGYNKLSAMMKKNLNQSLLMIENVIKHLSSNIRLSDGEKIRMSDLIAEIHNTFLLFLQERGIRFISISDPDTNNINLPYGENWKIILRNILSNIINHSKPGLITLEVLNKEKLIIQITDNGIPVPEEVQEIYNCEGVETFEKEFPHIKSIGMSLIKKNIEMTKTKLHVSVENGKNIYSLTVNT